MDKLENAKSEIRSQSEATMEISESSFEELVRIVLELRRYNKVIDEKIDIVINENKKLREEIKSLKDEKAGSRVCDGKTFYSSCK